MSHINWLFTCSYRPRILELITFYQKALQVTSVHCATFYQSPLRHEQFTGGCIVLFRVGSGEEKLVVMFRTDSPVKGFEGDRA